MKIIKKMHAKRKFGSKSLLKMRIFIAWKKSKDGFFKTGIIQLKMGLKINSKL